MGMRRTKFYFGLMILFFAALILGVSALYQEFTFLENPVTTGYTFFGTINPFSDDTTISYLGSNGSVNQQCRFAPPEKPTIILRIDDLGAWHYIDTVKPMMEEIKNREMAVSLGVIPYNLEKDRPFIDYMDSIRENLSFEITQHGYFHNASEFENLSYDEAYLRIQAGKNLIVNNLRVIPSTFIPPSNEYSADTIRALNDSGFKIISARSSEHKYDGVINYIGADTGTLEYEGNNSLSIERTIDECRRSLDMKNLCVVMLHPQDFVNSSDPSQTDPVKYEQYTKLLTELQGLNAEFKTFKDLINC